MLKKEMTQKYFKREGDKMIDQAKLLGITGAIGFDDLDVNSEGPTLDQYSYCQLLAGADSDKKCSFSYTLNSGLPTPVRLT